MLHPYTAELILKGVKDAETHEQKAAAIKYYYLEKSARKTKLQGCKRIRGSSEDLGSNENNSKFDSNNGF